MTCSYRCGHFRMVTNYASPTLGEPASFDPDMAHLQVTACPPLETGRPPEAPAPDDESWTARLDESGDTLHALHYGVNGRAWTYRFDENPKHVHVHWQGDLRAIDLASDLGGIVLSFALCRQGTVCLHGGAVTCNGSTLVLLGNSGHGKSTFLCGALQAGAQLLSDDLIALAPHGPSLLPWHDRLLLSPQACARLHVPPEWCAPHTRFHEKLALRVPSRPTPLDPAPVPIDAVYVLRPRDPALLRPRLETLHGGQALAALMPQTMPRFWRPSWANQQSFLRLAQLVRSTPIHALTMPDDLDALDPSVRSILGMG